MSPDPPLPSLGADAHDDLRSAVGSLHDFVGLRDRTIRARVSLLCSLLVLNIADVFSTTMVLQRGGRELNPVMAPIVDAWWAPLLVKLAVIALMWCAAIRAPIRSHVASTMLAIGVAFYAVIVTWNLIGLISSS